MDRRKAWQRSMSELVLLVRVVLVLVLVQVVVVVVAAQGERCLAAPRQVEAEVVRCVLIVVLRWLEMP